MTKPARSAIKNSHGNGNAPGPEAGMAPPAGTVGPPTQAPAAAAAQVHLPTQLLARLAGLGSGLDGGMARYLVGSHRAARVGVVVAACASALVARPALAMMDSSGWGRLVTGLFASLPLVLLQLSLLSLFDWCYARTAAGEAWRFRSWLLVLATTGCALALTLPPREYLCAPFGMRLDHYWSDALLAASASPAAVLAVSRGRRGWFVLFSTAQLFVLLWFGSGGTLLLGFLALTQPLGWLMMAAHSRGQAKRLAQRQAARPRWSTLAGIALSGWLLIAWTSDAAHAIGLETPWRFDTAPWLAVRDRHCLLDTGFWPYSRLYGLWLDWLALHAVWTVWLSTVAVRQWLERTRTAAHNGANR